MSSANSRSCEVMIDGRSLIKIRKSRVPSKLPCGTPESTGRELDSCMIVHRNTLRSAVQVEMKLAP